MPDSLVWLIKMCLIIDFWGEPNTQLPTQHTASGFCPTSTELLLNSISSNSCQKGNEGMARLFAFWILSIFLSRENPSVWTREQWEPNTPHTILPYLTIGGISTHGLPPPCVLSLVHVPCPTFVLSRTHLKHDGPIQSCHTTTWFDTVGCRNVLGSSSYTETGII